MLFWISNKVYKDYEDKTGFINQHKMHVRISPGSSNHIIFCILISQYLYKPINGIKQKTTQINGQVSKKIQIININILI